eukprot:GHVN01104030.1.p1 GENE.GHVN01104030.1~~GHVN01104030.1.p1  ORF type:complete len:304 (-),score=55.75 GHVN01104030.1:355-1149(-)
MTLCAGVCVYQRGGYCSIRLSEALLKFRTVHEYKETLLHEMIHAYLFVKEKNRDRDGHGPHFLSHMNRINQATGLNITVYHSFHDEVNHYRTHVWRCDGPCQQQPPYFGTVKRAMNRAPGATDPWYERHRLSCGGRFTKVSEPLKRGKALPASSSKSSTSASSGCLNSSQTTLLGFYNVITTATSTPKISKDKPPLSLIPSAVDSDDHVKSQLAPPKEEVRPKVKRVKVGRPPPSSPTRSSALGEVKQPITSHRDVIELSDDDG